MVKSYAEKARLEEKARQEAEKAEKLERLLEEKAHEIECLGYDPETVEPDAETAAQIEADNREEENTMLNKMYRITLNRYPAQVDKIVIYKEGEKLAEIEKLSDLLPGLDRVEAFYLPEEPKTARKENLNRKDVYTLRSFASYDRAHKWPIIALYIPADMVQFEDLGEFCAMEHDGEKDYLHKYRLTLPAADTLRRHCERLNVSTDWTPPAGGHWSRGLGDYNNAYDTISEGQQEARRKLAETRGEEYEPYNVVHWTETRQTEEGLQVETTSTGYHRIERDDARQERERLAAKLSEILSTCHISHYDIARLEAAGLRIVEA